MAVKHVIVSIDVPKGISVADLSRRFPDVSFSITNGHWISKDERVIYITSNNWNEQYFDFLKNHSSVKNIQQIGNITRIHIKSQFLKEFEQKEITILYPTVLKNGKHRIEFLIDKKQMAALENAFENVKVLKIADSYRNTPKLTQRQEEILWNAYSFGYFKYPREITLTDLAKLLKVSKATLSQSLRTIENKAIKLLLEK